MASRLFLLSLALAATATAATGADPDRERKVRVALALQSAPATDLVATAPQPRPKTPFPGFSDGYSQAVAGHRVLVVYVGCEGRHPIEAIDNCVVATQKELAPYPAGTIIVAYPSGGSMVEHSRLKCADFEKVAAAAAAAVKKKPVAGAEPVIQKPLDWQLKNTAAAGNCSYCGSTCACKDGDCPSKCPVATAPATAPAVTVSQPQPALTLYRDANGNYFYLPTGSTCPTGKCPNQR